MGRVLGKRLLVRMKQSAESNVLPCRLDLEFQGDLLKFSKEKSLFWVDLELTGNGEIEGKGDCDSRGRANRGGGVHDIWGGVSDSRGAGICGGLPLLAEARWWGRDQFRGPTHRASGSRLAQI